MPIENAPVTPAPVAGLAADAADAAVQLDAVVARQNELNNALALSDRQARQFGRAMTTALIDLAIHGRSAGDVLRSLILSLSRLALNAAFKPLEGIFGQAFKGLMSGGFASLSQPFSASGGLAAPAALQLTASGTGTAGLANALGPSPMQSANSIGGGGPATSIVLNVTTPDAESFRRSETQIAALLSRAVGQGQRNL